MEEEENFWIRLIAVPGMTAVFTLLLKYIFDRYRVNQALKREIFSEISRSLSSHRELKRQILDLLITKYYYMRLRSTWF